MSRLAPHALVATSLLGAMLILLLTSAAYQSTHPWVHWVRAFAEAGAVGAMADWYAVVALFRHPLGLPILHSAIIPRNKDRIGIFFGHLRNKSHYGALWAEIRLRVQAGLALLDAVGKVVLGHGHQISGLITDVVKSWNAKEVSEKVEIEIGKDLQLIRINGTLVGGTVDIVLHTLTYLIA